MKDDPRAKVVWQLVRMCVTWDGEEFEWPFVNVPWRVLSCS